MDVAPIKLIALPPDPSDLAKVIASFGREPGTITAFDDARIALVRNLGYDDTQVTLASFGDLIGQALLEIRGTSFGLLPTRGQVSAAVRLACQDLAPDSAFYRCRDYPGFHEAVADCLKELHHWGIDEQALDRAVQLASGPLKSRLEALLEVERASSSTLSDLGRISSSHRAETLIETEGGSPLHFERLLVLAGTEALPVELRALEKIAKLGVKVTVVVDWAPQGFDGAAKIAQALGLAIVPPKKPHWTAQLFGSGASPSGPEAVIYSAANVLSECEWALRQCQKEHSVNAVAEHRIVIVAPDGDKYVPLLQSCAKRFDFQLNVPSPIPLLSNGFASLILRILQMLSVADLRGLPTVLSSTYLASDLEARQHLLDQVSEWRARGFDPWETLGSFAEAHRDELPWLWPLLKWRHRALAAQRTLSEWHEMLDDLLRVDALEKAAQDSESQKRQHDQRAQTALLRALADFAPSYDSRHKQSLDLAGFVRQVRALWELESVMMPGERKGFRVVTDPVLIGEADVVVALGLVEGVIPRRRKENPILSDEDRRDLHQLLPDKPPLLNSFDEAKEERDKLVRICAAAKKKLILGYPQTEGDRDNVPTSYLSEVERTLPKVARDDYSHRLIVPEEADCRLPADLLLRLALDAPSRQYLAGRLVSSEAKDIIRPKFEIGVRIQELKEVLNCPFQAGVHHRLRLRTRSRELERKLNRLPVRADMLAAPSVIHARMALEAEKQAMIAEEAPYRHAWELNLLAAGADRMIQGWLERQAEVLRLWQPTAVQTQVKFGSEQLADSYTVQGRTLKLIGEVDGMSEVGNYRVIHEFRPAGFALDGWRVPDGDWMEIGILIRLARKNDNKVIAFDMVAPDKRALMSFQRGRDTRQLGNKQLDIVHGVFSMPPEKLKEIATTSLQSAVAKLDAATMQAIPGDHCKTCDLGELCRSSSVFVELADVLMEQSNG